MEARERIIVALDVDTTDKAIWLVEKLRDHVGCFKIGLELIYSMLAEMLVDKLTFHRVERLFEALDGKIFWDGKLNDIPNTVGGASKAIVGFGVKMFNVHVSAGREAVQKAVENKGDSLVLGVTVLTSIGERESVLIFGNHPENKVFQFVDILVSEGADGVICSPQEVKRLREIKKFEKLIFVTPGIRPAWAATDDQKRITTPADAIKAGVDYLVIGRPITNPPKEIGTPVDAAKRIAEEISSVL